MNNIYVETIPENCLDCEFCSKRNYGCILMKKDVREYRDECPLNFLSDRLAEERKKVDTIPNMFWQIAKCSEFILFLQTDKILNNSQIILRGNDDTYNWGLTKENYLEACKIAKKLFLGEE